MTNKMMKQIIEERLYLIEFDLENLKEAIKDREEKLEGYKKTLDFNKIALCQQNMAAFKGMMIELKETRKFLKSLLNEEQ